MTTCVVIRTGCFQAMPLGSGLTKAIDPMLSDDTPLEARHGSGCCRLPVLLTGFAHSQDGAEESSKPCSVRRWLPFPTRSRPEVCWPLVGPHLESITTTWAGAAGTTAVRAV